MNELMTEYQTDSRYPENFEYFRFEEDFVEEGIRCIPMAVRLKLDIVGIKLKLAAWAKFKANHKMALASMAVDTSDGIAEYDEYLRKLIYEFTGNEPDRLPPSSFEWAQSKIVPIPLLEKAAEFDWTISIEQWSALSDLKRFALLKLCRPGHENRNFPLAVKEFGII